MGTLVYCQKTNSMVEMETYRIFNKNLVIPEAPADCTPVIIDICNQAHILRNTDTSKYEELITCIKNQIPKPQFVLLGNQYISNQSYTGNTLLQYGVLKKPELLNELKDAFISLYEIKDILLQICYQPAVAAY